MNNNTPKVSVVMAGRNSDINLLKDAIGSIFNQTFQDFEFIFVDDGSDEPMEPIVKSLFTDERISVYRIEPSGLGAALNHGISHAKGELIARIDDDDIALPTRLEKQVAFMDEHLEVSCVGTQIYYRVGNRYIQHPPFPITHERIINSLVHLHFVMSHTTLLYRKASFEKIGGYRIPGGGQDLDLLLQLGTVGNLSNIDEFLTFYSLASTGLSVTNPKKKLAYIYALEHAKNKNNYKDYSHVIDASIAKLHDNRSMFDFIYTIKRNFLIWKVRLFGNIMIHK